MPLAELIKLKDAELGIWKIEEDAAFFINKLQLNKREKQYLAGINNEKRYLQWLSSRSLIREMLATPDFIEMQANYSGTPILRDHPYHISISHSGNYSTVLLSKQRGGLDIEQINEKIIRIAPKFMSIEELECIEKKDKIEMLYVYWCAKEAMYKLYGEKQLTFKEHLRIDPFKYVEKGTVKCKIVKDNYFKELVAVYKKIDDYMLVYMIADQ